MRRLRFRLLLQPLFRHRRLNTERMRRTAGLPPCQRACQRDAGPSRRLHRHDRDRRGRRCPRSEGRNRHEGGKGRISLLPAQHLHLFRLPVHTLDMFFRCTVEDTLHFKAMDDAADLFFLPLKDIRTEEFGLGSIRKGVGIFLEDMRKNKSE